MTLVWAPGYNGITDPDAQTYIAAVEAADGQAIEGDVALAINDFVVGCKDDGIWDAIKVSCILAGARTLSGALVPLKGTAPTNNNFVSGDYNRETGLVGNGSTKYLNTNTLNSSNPINNNHLSVWKNDTVTGTNPYFIGVLSGSNVNAVGQVGIYNNSSNFFVGASAVGLIGVSRATASTVTVKRPGDSVASGSLASTAAPSLSHFVYNINSGGSTGTQWSASRLSFYSIGESIDLEKLDNRTTRLMNLISYSLASGLPDLSTIDLDAASYIGAGYRAGGTLS